MKKEEIIEKLKELGINTKNAYPKSSFINVSEPCVGLYEREMKEDFYFYNKYDKKIYKFPESLGINSNKYDYDDITEKYLVTMHDCELVWEDKPYIELPDAPYKDMTLRQYACIQLRIPNSGLSWLDNLIKQTSPL